MEELCGRFLRQPENLCHKENMWAFKQLYIKPLNHNRLTMILEKALLLNLIIFHGCSLYIITLLFMSMFFFLLALASKETIFDYKHFFYQKSNIM